jgi:hypothetical protein
MKSYVRITAVPYDPQDYLGPVTIDAVIDEQHRIVGDHPLFALQGDIQSHYKHALAFTIDEEGETDWGEEHAKNNQRRGRCTIRSIPIREEQSFTLSGDGYEEDYTIKAIVPLLIEK